MNEPQQLLTIQQAADLVQAHPQTIRRWIYEGDLKAYQFGQRLIRIPRDELIKFATPASELTGGR